MARTKQPSRKATQKPQPDPWLAWCSPVPDGDDPKERLYLSIDDYLEICESSYPSIILESAREAISNATKEIKIPKLEDLTFDYVNDDSESEDGTRYSDIPLLRSALTHRLSISDATDKVFAKLEMIRAAGPYEAVGARLKKEAGEFIRFLLDVQKFGREKIAQAMADGHDKAAAKLENAYNTFCVIQLTGDIYKDAEQLFLVRQITPEDFRVAMRRAFKLDREATSEINNGKQAAPPPQQCANEELLITIAKDAKRGADAAESNGNKLNTLTKWMTDWRKNGPKIDANNPPKTKISSTIRDKIINIWECYKKNPEPIARGQGGQPTHAECLKFRGHIIVHNGESLLQLLSAAKKNPNEAPIATFKRLINSGNRNKSRHS